MLDIKAPNYADDVQELRHALTAYGVSPKYHSTQAGPRITRYLFQIPTGTKINQLVKLGPEITSYTSSPAPVTVQAPIPGTNLFAIDVPQEEFTPFKPSELWPTSPIEDVSQVPLYMGKDASGAPLCVNLSNCPHLLVSGATQSGKSVFMHSLLTGIIRNAPEAQLVMMDFKQVEFAAYDGAKALAFPIISELADAVDVLQQLSEHMLLRFNVFKDSGTVSYTEYNAAHTESPAKPIVVVIDELADLMEGPLRKQATELLSALLRKSRAAGIFFIVSTQHPAARSIAGFIKANIPARVAFRTTSVINSRVILDRVGAERLAGRGDGLLLSPDTGPNPVRFQAPYITTDEIKRIIKGE